ncbi:MAG: collagen-like protein [Clostridiales bacterium]|nr:collagen-like protein [Clostridiales bacterium]
MKKADVFIISLVAACLALVLVLVIVFSAGIVGTGNNGKSAYDIAVENGFEGTVEEWLESLKGADGTNGTNGTNGSNGSNGSNGAAGPQGPAGPTGPQGSTGETGAAGKSAYEIYKEYFEKNNPGKEALSEEEWLESLKGADGTGSNGKSAYEIFAEQFAKDYPDKQVPSEEEWLASLQGQDGAPGKDGENGQNGENGERGSLWFVGNAEPEKSAGITVEPREGDFYFRTYSEFSGRKGYEIYAFMGGKWVMLVDMSSDNPNADSQMSYEITTADQLAELSELVKAGETFVGKTFALEADIDLSSIDNWMPIGTSASPFAGKFDGQDHTISNLTVKSGSYLGLFGYVGVWQQNIGAEICNLTIDNAQITGSSWVAAFVGQTNTYSNLNNLKLTGHVEITATSYGAAGIVARGNYTGNLSDITVDVDSTSFVQATGASTGYQVGGIVAWVGEGNFTYKNLTSNINAIGGYQVGGIVGNTNYSTKWVNCTSTGNITLNVSSAKYADKDAIGGIAGMTSIQKKDGQIVESTAPVFDNCHYTGVLSSNYDVQPAYYNHGLVGSNTLTVITNSSSLIISDDISQGADWDAKSKVSARYGIGSVAGLEAFRDSVNEGKDYAGETIILLKDLDLSGIDNWTPIGNSTKPFLGVFDGHGYKISNLVINLPEQDNVGLFGQLGATGIVKNVVIDGATVIGRTAVGVAVGTAFNYGKVSGITVLNSSVAGLKNLGGIVGSGYIDISNCIVDGLTAVATPAINGKGVMDDGDKVGGIIGFLADSNYTVNNCRVYNANLTAYRDLGAVVGAYNGAQVLEKVTGISVDNVTLTIDHSVNAGDGDINVRYVIGRLINADSDTVNAALIERESISNVTIDYIGVPYITDSEGNWHIYNSDGLVAFQQYYDAIPSNSGEKGMAGKTIYLEKEIDLNDINWEPIALAAPGQTAFKGTFDGQGNKILNLNIDKSSADKFVGFFALVDNNAVITNVIFENATVKGGGQMTGVVAGRFGSSGRPTMSNVTLQGTIQVSGSKFIGAVVGHLSGTMSNITVNADDGSYVSGLQIGGIAGATGIGAGASCTNVNIKIDITGRYVGGLVGWEQGGNEYHDCHYTGTITSTTTGEPANACFGAVIYGVGFPNKTTEVANTIVDEFTFEGTIVSGSLSGFYHVNDEYAVADVTNSTAKVTRDGEVVTYTANADGVISSDK